MKYALLLLTANGASHESAYQFARALVTAGHTIERIFFYSDGVLQTSQLLQPAQGDTNATQRWQAFATEHNIDMVVCIAAALKRGLLDQTESKRYGQQHFNLAKGFTLSGLGQLVEASVCCDRLVTFGH